MLNQRIVFSILCLTILFSCNTSNTANQKALTSIEAPKLVLFLVVDQFRADYLLRYKDILLPDRQSNGKPGGFRYLMDNGAYYPYARHDVLQAMTGPGHATLSTGAYPYRNGIPINKWYDKNLDLPMYCAADNNVATVGSTRTGSCVGTSPRNLIGGTLADEFKNGGQNGKIVSVSLKDRAAILMGGRRSDASVWFDTKAFRWVSSKFYFNDGSLPLWVQSLNEDIEKRKGESLKWSDSCKYSDDGKPNFDRTSVIGEKTSLNFPYGIDITHKAALAAVEKYQLGQDEKTDFLSISYSSHDTLGHRIGPNRCEMEALTLHLDKVLSDLFSKINKQVAGGLSSVLIVLTGDHGVSPSPEYLQSNRVESGIVDEQILQKELESYLQAKYGSLTSGLWVLYVEDFNYYLNEKAAIERGIQVEDLESSVKRFLENSGKFLFVFTKKDVTHKELPAAMWQRQILHSYFPGRSGDVIAIPRPYTMDEEYYTTHITGYTYDATVPLMFKGSGIRSGIYAQKVEVVDIAPTIAFLTRVLPPPLAEGRILHEILVR